MSFSSRLTGFVLIRCEGGYPTRFLNAAADAGIPLWDIRHKDGVLWCRAPAADYRRLRPAARRGCVRMRVQKRGGLVFHLRRFRLRFGLAVGTLLFLGILQAFSSRIWVINIEGNLTVPDSTIRAILEPLGIREGVSFADVDLTDLRLTALQKLPSLTWLTVNQSGSIVTVEVRERTSTEPLSDTAPANLVAVCDGVILRVNAVTGQAVVKPGDAVTRGDLLISGVMDSSVGPQLKRAAGSVTARTTHTLTVTVPLCETVTNRTARVIERPSLTLFGLQIPLYTDTPLRGEPTVTTETRPLRANGVALPIGLYMTRYHYPVEETVVRTAEEADILAEQQLATAEKTLRETLTVEERVVHREITDEGVTLTAVYTGTQELTVAAPIA